MKLSPELAIPEKRSQECASSCSLLVSLKDLPNVISLHLLLAAKILDARAELRNLNNTFWLVILDEILCKLL